MEKPKHSIQIDNNAPGLLHMDEREPQQRLAADVLDLIESRFRQHNGKDDADTSMVCGGCMRSLMFGITNEFLHRMDASTNDALAHYRQQLAVAESEADPVAALLRSLGIDINRMTQ